MPPRFLIRHQLGAIAATGADFSMMIVCVEIAGISPVAATAIGAGCGAITNFLLGRRWIFRVHDRSAMGQGVRYALVSAGSLALNSGGEFIGQGALGLPYIVARILVAFAVGIAWNYPMHRHFVFRPAAATGSGA